MKKTVISLGALLLASMLIYGSESQHKELKPSAENVFVLKHKKRKVRISNTDMKNIKPNDISGIDVKGDTLFLHVSDSIVSIYDINKKVKL